MSARKTSEILLCFGVLSAPFTWSFLVSIGGFLVRPFDIVILVLTGLFFLSTNVRVARSDVLSLYLACFSILVFWVLLSSIFDPGRATLITALKFGGMFALMMIVANILVSMKFHVSNWNMKIAALCLMIIIVVKLDFSFVQNLTTNIGSSPKIAILYFWRDIFSTNFFGSETYDVIGTSFRNTAAIGFLALAIFTSAFLNSGASRLLILACAMILCILCISRGAIAGLIVFGLLNLARRQKYGFMVKTGGALLVVAFVSLGFVQDVAGDRLNDSFGRSGLIEQGLGILQQDLLFGAGEDAIISTEKRDKIVHNVPLALGATYGVVALLAGLGIVLLNAWSFLLFSLLTWSTSHDKDKRLYVTFATAAFVVSFRPMVSGSIDRFFSIPEWFCFSLVMAGHVYYSQSKSGRAGFRRDGYAGGLHPE